MKDLLFDGLFDTLKILPYLFITFLILEFIEHKFKDKNEKILIKNKKYGPLVGSMLGAIPQCGFSSMAAQLYSSRVITTGSLIAVFLSTSDEMIPIMISEKVSFLLLIKIITFKIIIGMLIGFIIDFIYRKKNDNITQSINHMCEDEGCSCEDDGLIISSIKHTLKISIFILIANILINFTIFKIGEDNISNILLHHNLFSYFISSFIGLIPNCASSIILTELFVSKFITIGTLLSGLLTGSGLGILLLFKTNKNIKENIIILSIIYFVGVIIGILVDFIL